MEKWQFGDLLKVPPAPQPQNKPNPQNPQNPHSGDFEDFHIEFCRTLSHISKYSPRKKKEYAKVAIPLTGSKGQALRVWIKKSPHLRYASGSIFFSKTLTAAAPLAV